MVKFTSSQAEKYRAIINKAADNLTDDDAIDVPMMFERWQTDTAYEIGKRVCYNDKLYKVLQAHTSQADWVPDTAVSLYVEVTPPGVIPVWKQPTGSTDAYMIGDKVRYPDENGTVYVSTVDNNVWQPGVYGWDEVWQQ